MKKSISSDMLWQAIITLSVIGISLALYLLYNYLAATPSAICSISETINCDAVTKGELSTFLGLPVALIGLVGYIAVLLSALYRNKKLALFMTTFGMLFCLRITLLELFVVHVYCPVCIVCQIDMIAVFILSFILYRRK